MVGVSPSSSEPLALQVSAVDVVTPLPGLTLTESTVGSVLSTVTLALSESVPLSESVAVAVHRMLSLGELVEVVRVSVSPVPRLVEVLVFVHA